jgi:hypothetical protein
VIDKLLELRLRMGALPRSEKSFGAYLDHFGYSQLVWQRRRERRDGIFGFTAMERQERS